MLATISELFGPNYPTFKASKLGESKFFVLPLILSPPPNQYYTIKPG